MHRFLSALLLAGVATLAAAEPTGLSPSLSASDIDFFEKRIRPVLAEHCYGCHSAQSEKLKAGLRVDSRQGLLDGGESGPAVLPGDPAGSLLIRAVHYTDKDLRMPPRKGKLADRQIADLETWVRLGAPWPAESSSPSGTPGKVFTITDKDRAYWAFQPIGRPQLPTVQDGTWASNPIDLFVLAELESKGLTPNRPATRRDLIRRVYFDLLGLPPTPEEVTEFLSDPSPTAYPRLVDRLLARPEYGERWARHWLDVVRYAQSNGYERDGEKPLAWRYRDYVIEALNQDKPYDRFIQEQIAGDELPDATAQSVAATAFQRLGVWDDEPDDKVAAEYDALDDIISTTSAAFLGLTLGCARCHDHKFDPISQADYYRFLAFFRNVRPNENARFAFDSANYRPLAPPEQARKWQADREHRIQRLESELACASQADQQETLQTRLRAAREEKPPFEWTLAVREQGGQPLPTHLLIRGNPHAPGPALEPGFPSVLTQERPRVKPGAESTGRRLALAQWLSSKDNPLPARVAVNRVWHHHFGEGLVKTTTDFGHAGLLPSHPQLLDWLATEFIASGWSFKGLHRLILLSSTYQMSSQAGNPKALTIDPGAQWLWRQRLRRLEAESVWDSALSVSGELDLQRGGRGFFPHLEGEVLAGGSRPGLDWETSHGSEASRRSVYTFLRRTMLAPLLEAFDYNNTSSPLGERPSTTVAPQALMLLNSVWAQQRAEALARRLAQEVGSDPRKRIQRGYELALARPPTARELNLALALVDHQAQASLKLQSRLTFWPDAPNALFGEYMKQLEPNEYLRGPKDGWSYFRGRWSEPYEGIRSVDRQRGPFALWKGGTLKDGVVEVSFYLNAACESASILFRSTAQKDEQRGYELIVEPRQQRLSLRRQSNSVETLATAAFSPRPGSLPVRIEMTGAHLRVWLGPNLDNASGRQPTSPTKPMLEVLDPNPILAEGSVGVRCSGAPVSLDDFILCPPAGAALQLARFAPVDELSTTGAQAIADREIERRAWRSFCLLLLNLNEFVYVD